MPPVRRSRRWCSCAPATPPRKRRRWWLLVALGAASLAGAGHAATLFLGLELISLSLIALFAFPLTGPALEAGYKFLVMSGLGAVGAAARRRADLCRDRRAGFRRLGRPRRAGRARRRAAAGRPGLQVFAGAVPHVDARRVRRRAGRRRGARPAWYRRSAVAIAILRLNSDGASAASRCGAPGLAALGAASVLLGNLLALRQPLLPRMLGYSTIAHSGYHRADPGVGRAAAPARRCCSISASMRRR